MQRGMRNNAATRQFRAERKRIDALAPQSLRIIRAIPAMRIITSMQ